MVRDALLEGTGPFDLRAVASAAELDDYLARRGYVAAPTPSLVLVDLEQSAPDGLTVIERLKGDVVHRRIPVIALVRDGDAAAVAQAYDAGANTVLPKPVTFLALVRLMKVFTAYWLEAAALPREAP
jgi:CheY-like chemotaxis protein